MRRLVVVALLLGGIGVVSGCCPESLCVKNRDVTVAGKYDSWSDGGYGKFPVPNHHYYLCVVDGADHVQIAVNEEMWHHTDVGNHLVIAPDTPAVKGCK